MQLGFSSGYIDAHVHLWTDNFSKYPLASGFKPSDLAVRRFMPGDILAKARRNAVQRVVLVQMSYYAFDNSLMLDAISHDPSRFRGIAVIDIDQRDPAGIMRRLARSHVRGFRVVALEPAASPLNSPGLRKMFACGASDNLAICFLTSPEFLPGIGSLCAKFPDTPVVVDHMARIGINGTIRSGDVDALCRLAKYPRTMVKLSAFYALGRKRPPHDDLAPLLERLFNAFGPSRLMWASDSPFQLMRETYHDSIALVSERLPFLSNSDREELLCRCAERLFFR
jgi:predicted TIM-barrel fold metal-dependent hydrolase